MSELMFINSHSPPPSRQQKNERTHIGCMKKPPRAQLDKLFDFRQITFNRSVKIYQTS